MKPNRRWAKGGLRPALILGLAALPLAAQTPSPAASSVAQSPSRPVAREGCDPNKLETYLVRSVTVNHPLKFLHAIQAQLDRIRPKLLVKKGDQFSTVAADADRRTLEAEFPVPADLNSPVSLRIATATVTNCQDGKLDVEYFVFSSQFLPSWSGLIEARRRETVTPQDALHVVETRSNSRPAQPTGAAASGGVDGAELLAVPQSNGPAQSGGAEVQGTPASTGAATTQAAPKASPYQLTPTFGYNASDHLFGGAHLRLLKPLGSTAPLQTLDLEGAGSGSFHDFSAALGGSPNSGGWISSVNWQLTFHSQSLPTGGTYLQQNNLAGQIAATSKPLTPAALILRFGGQIEGGNMQSGFPQASLAEGTVPAAGYGDLKLYAGLSFGTKHHAFSSSYGIELGGNSAQLGVDWRKHIGDVSWDTWFPIGDHRPLQIETRFTAGGIQTLPGAAIPVGERFFGGNVQQNFISGDYWDFRANPVIRGIPAQRFFATASGAGADRFTAFNLTAAPVIWHSPLLPKEISGDPDFNKQLKDGWDRVESNIAATYTAKDPNTLAMAKDLPDAQSALDGLLAAVNAVKPSSGTPSREWSACNAAIARARGRVKTTSDLIAKDSKLTEHSYGNLLDLFADPPKGSKLLPNVIDSCEGKLNATLKDGAITEGTLKVRTVLETLEQLHSQIDDKKATTLAERDLVYPKRVFGTILNDLNLWSVSPVGIFDVAKIGSDGDSRGGLRYAAGGGVRLILVSHANFTLGYARNLNRQPGEGTGALFFTIGITELLR